MNSRISSIIKYLFKGSNDEGDGASTKCKNNRISGYQREKYNGFSIEPIPQEENGQYRVRAIIRKGNGEHQFIRCDVVMSEADCVDLTLRKARVAIDQQGESLFD